MSAAASQRRGRALDELSGVTWDLLVVGGGIVGSRVAYEAARHGLRVALVDAGDFGGATSGSSSKFVHGGLRYLATGQLRLVRMAQREREVLLARVAPHLVRPQPMLLAEPAGYPLPVYAAGLALSRTVAGRRAPWPRLVSSRRARELVPALRANGRRSCALLPEAQTHDARLTLATVAAAAEAGAGVANYVRLLRLERSRGRVVAAVVACDGEPAVTVRCRALVNATGPWVDAVRALEQPGCPPLARLSKGVHLLLPLEGKWGAGVVCSRDGSRATFAVPFHGMLLLGVTDTPYDGDPLLVAPEPGDVEELLDEASRFLPGELLGRDRIRHAFAGLRALPEAEGDTGRLPREHVVAVGPGGMVSVAGGKLTTHRLIAIDVLRRLPSDLRPRRLRPSDAPLPGAAPVPAPALLAELDPDVADHLLHLYGSDTERLLSYAATLPHALERIDPAGPDVWAQVHHALEHEWALTVEDVVQRRTTLAVRGLASDAVRARIAEVCFDAPSPGSPVGTTTRGGERWRS